MNKWRIVLSLVLAMAALAALTLTLRAANTIVWQPALSGLPTTGLIRDVAFGDVNNDGKPDLIAAGTNGVVVYIGNGAGVWNGVGFSTGLPVAGQYGHVIVADFNNDGKLDIAASQSSVGAVGAWTGDGAGNWTAWAGLPTGTYQGLAFSDVNHDGWPDLIVAGGAPVYPGILVFRNAFASFSQTTSITTTGTYYDLAAGYVDGDTWLDVAAASQAGGGLKFWRNSFGSWTYASNGLTTTNTFRGVALDDVDLDGKLELVASRFGFPSATGGGVFIYKYDSLANTWSLAPNQIALTGSYYRLKLNDLNNDGWLDLIAGGGSTTGSPGLYTWLGSVSGFAATTSPTSTGSADRIDVGDFDHNGLPDIAAADNAGGGVRAWADVGVRDSIGAWTPLVSPQTTGVMNALGYGDFNRDGDLDVIVSRDLGAGLAAYVGDGGNSWASCNITMTPGAQTGTWQDVAVGPWGNISSIEPDVIAASGSGGGIRYFGHSGGCGYWYDFSLVSTGSYRGLSVADMDHDFAYDIVAAPSDGTGGLRVWSGPNHTAMPNPTSTGNYYDTALGDFNHDGKLDIVAVGDSNGLQVFKQVSIRSFQQVTVTSSLQYYAVAVGDFDDDGNLDIVAVANGTSNGVDVWKGDGAGNFALWSSPDTTHQFFDVAVGDVNHDGWPDILAGGENIGPQVWLGDGGGGWIPSNTNLPTTGSYFRSQFGHIDHDGNLDILGTTPGGGLKLWAAAEAAPPTISNIQPSGWISTTQSPTVYASVLDTGSGISVTSGLYRYSTNGGGSWSSLLPASVSGSDGVTSTQTVTATNVPFNQDSGTQNRIEFRLADMVGNLGTAQGTIKIDVTPPTAPTSLSSSSHTVSVWSNDNTVAINWSGATDATSGVSGYSVLFDHAASTLPDMTIETFATSYTSAVLADDNDWYAHVRTRDAAGNWSTTARHLGPFLIDTTPPSNPASVSSSSHTPNVWSGDPTIAMSWSGASDGAGSGVSGYSFVWDTSSGTLPNTTVDTFGTSTTSPAQSTGNNHWFHLRTRDLAGNWSATAVHRGPYYIDVTPPSSFASSPSSVGSTSFTVSWSGSDAHSGLANYDVQYRDKTINGSWTTWKSATTSTSSTFFGNGGHIYEFRSRARDNVGNLEAYPGSYDSRTEVRTIDVFVKNPGIEVNQAVQDLNNSVTLIAGKRTFVRCHVQSDAGTIGSVPARLRVYRGATYMGTLSPSNAGATVSIKTGPDRSTLNDSFYFDVPTGWLSAGSVRFECEVNTPQKYAENDYGNNIRSVTLGFVNAPTMNVLLVDAPYKSGGTVRHVRDVDRTLLASWLRRAYPIKTLSVGWAYLDPPYNSLPNVDTLNSDLFWNKIIRWISEGEDFFMRYYGMVSDVGGFMRGKAMDIPHVIASGPAGIACCGSGSWDFDGSYADWYGGHEIGHTYGRYHAEFCGAADGAAYPYPNGDISPTRVASSANALYGFDSVGPTVYPPSWKDVMTYCDNEWVSDFTYEGIYSRMVAEKPVMAADVRATGAAAGEYLIVQASILTPTDVITLSTFHRISNAVELPGRDLSGAYSIRLFGAGNSLLANYAFSPKFSPEADEPVGLIAEMVAWVTDTQKIAIWHGATALITRTVSAHAPVVTLNSPNGGETLSGSNVNVAWTGTDADAGDSLTYSLDYSRDGGATWQALSGSITQTQVTLDLTQLPGTTQAKFRVWASDGVNTALDDSNGTFTVTFKSPKITSIAPVSGTQYVLSQTTTFEGSAFDPEDGVLGDARLNWTSSLQGALGTGQMLQTTDLIIGTHVITLTATDSNNNTATATTTIVITGELPTIEIYLPLILR